MYNYLTMTISAKKLSSNTDEINISSFLGYEVSTSTLKTKHHRAFGYNNEFEIVLEKNKVTGKTDEQKDNT